MSQEKWITIQWVAVPEVGENAGFIESYTLPTGEIVHYNHEQDRINFEPLRPFIGEGVKYYRDGKLNKIGVLMDIDRTINGVRAIDMNWTDVPEEVKESGQKE